MNLEGMPRFFLGAYSPKGFYSGFGQLFAFAPKGRCFLLKGGPGCGKSTVLKKLASVLGEKGVSTELICCSADKESLDAVAAFDGSFVAVDATLPHPAEPKYPAVYERTVSLGECWDEAKIREKSAEIPALFDENKSLREQAGRYLSAGAKLLEEASAMEARAMDEEKIIRTALRLCSREFGRKTGEKGREKLRFLSAVTEEGVFFQSETLRILCDKIYVLEDECSAVSRLFMSTVRKSALEHGLDIITCRCPLFPNEKTEHIIIPSLRLGFISENRRHKTGVSPFRVIHSRRFVDEKALLKNKAKIRRTLRLAEKLIAEASLCMGEAGAVHKKLEAIYTPAMDFSLVEKKLSEIISEMDS